MFETISDSSSRREFIRVGSLAGLGFADILRLQHAAGNPATRKKDVNCIFLFIVGGMPHQDMWDLKPDAPSEIRGDFRPIDTVVPGIQMGDVIQGVATVTDKLAILRSMTHGDADHGRGFHIMMTGKKAGVGDFNGNQNNNQHPCLGSVVSRYGTPGSLSSYISVPNFLNSGGPSFLGASHGPFVIESEPAGPEFAVRDISLPAGITEERSQRRQLAINRLEEQAARADSPVHDLDQFYQKAFGIMTSRKAKQAFEIHRESKKHAPHTG